jgi:hypothetical protein
MKLIFNISLLCCLIFSSTIASAREIILIENLATSSEGDLLVNILVKKFRLPKELITLRNTNLPCETKSDAIIHLCLEANGELQVKKMNQYVVKNSLGVFLNQGEGEVR